MNNQSTTTKKPNGAMSLLDKFAQINSSIEDARRKVGDVRARLEQTHENICNVKEEKMSMLEQTELAKTETIRIEKDLKEAKIEHLAKLSEKERVHREQRIAKTEHDGMRKRIDTERIEFLERCREFRESCKRTRVAASILVLDGGGNFDAVKDTTDEVDLWRRLQDEELSDEEDDGNSANNAGRKHKKSDPEVEQAEKEEKESRQAFIEAECALHSERAKNEDAIKKCNARMKGMTQQRAQLARHRKEVEELEREIQSVKDAVVHENQLANTYEKECHRKKQSHLSSRNNNNNNNNNNGSYSNNFNPPHEASRSSNNPYNQQYRTPNQTSTSYPQRRREVVTNPYNKQTAGTNINPYASSSTRSSQNVSGSNQHGQNNNNKRYNGGPGRTNRNVQIPFASDVLHNAEITPEFGGQGQRGREDTQHPHRGRNVRNQRQFGTSISLGSGLGMTDELQVQAAFPSNPASSSAAKDNTDDDISDVSSTSSDEDILEFNIFGKK